MDQEEPLGITVQAADSAFQLALVRFSDALLRDYFASCALPLIGGGYTPNIRAEYAYQIADAMMEARLSKPKEQ